MTGLVETSILLIQYKYQKYTQVYRLNDIQLHTRIVINISSELLTLGCNYHDFEQLRNVNNTLKRTE